jgi:glutamine synthetase
VATDLERFVEAEGRAERVKDVRKKIDAEGVTYVYYQFASVTGRIMGKGVPAPHWETIAQKGFQLVYGSTANLFTDRHGNYIGYGPEAAWELVGVPSRRPSRRFPGTRASPASGALLPQPRGTATNRAGSSPPTAAGT